ncbi:phage N-6-adenine-methyltransferase [Vibrio fluvialis]|nr:phage N-6-adenine-methyltransferase [Vibrio fluvialis]EKO3527597.1 phage N-6-adenine-methyltransferase [Vibrio fluvialis]ELP3312403.1 phage N-6-adenine-methyltransferase [Vibrio fluvialis]
MNQYAKALIETQSQESHQLKQIGDQWQTPKALAWGLFSYFSPRLGSIVLDIFADDCNALLPSYYTASDNALAQDLAADLKRIGGSAAFGNPPYSRPFMDDEQHITGMTHIIEWCIKQRDQGAKIMLLIKAATSEKWFTDKADFIQYIEGRIAFEVPDWYKPATDRDKPSSAGFASAVMIFDRDWQWERRPVDRLSRDDLLAQGNVILEMMNKQVTA